MARILWCWQQCRTSHVSAITLIMLLSQLPPVDKTTLVVVTIHCAGSQQIGGIRQTL